MVIGIIAILISLLLPALNKAREAATDIKCKSNLRQIYTAAAMYANDYNGWVPPGIGTNPPNEPPFSSTNQAFTTSPFYITLTPYLPGTTASSGLRDNALYKLNPVFFCPANPSYPGELDDGYDPNFYPTYGTVVTSWATSASYLGVFGQYNLYTLKSNTQLANASLHPSEFAHTTRIPSKVALYGDTTNCQYIIMTLPSQANRPVDRMQRHNGHWNLVAFDGHVTQISWKTFYNTTVTHGASAQFTGDWGNNNSGIFIIPPEGY